MQQTKENKINREPQEESRDLCLATFLPGNFLGASSFTEEG